MNLLDAASIARALGGARRSGSGWVAKCPSHDDRNPSLSLTERGGKLLVFCHGGCDSRAVVAALRARNLWPEAEQPAPSRNGRADQGSRGAALGPVVAEYVYTDEGGEPLFKVTRHQPKSFRQWRPDGKGGWLPGIDGVRRVPYQLPAVVTAEEVVIVEGEKDVHTLCALGIVSTTSPGGAGKWDASWGAYFAGKRVTIVPDRDAPGMRHARQVAESLLPLATSVSVLLLDGAKDISEFLEKNQLSTQEIRELLRSAIPVTQETLDSVLPPLSGPAKPQDRAKSPGEYILTSSGGIKACLHNAVVLLQTDEELREMAAFDEFRNQIRVVKPPSWMHAKAGGEWTDQCDRDLLRHANTRGLFCSMEVIHGAVETVARERAFHPVRQYLEKCASAWDGQQRLHYWLHNYGGAERNDYTMVVGTRWMISAVARVFEPGCKADCCLVLEGKQGIGKSRALRTLGDPWFTDSLPDLAGNPRDAAQALSGVWIVELAELDAMSRAEASRIKAYLSTQIDRFRRPYGRNVEEIPRQCVFAGTCNHEAYLHDETGARRFWPVLVTGFDIDALARDRDLLWGEAVHMFREGVTWWLEGKLEIELTEREQTSRYAEDVWTDKIASFLDGLPAGADTSVAEVLERALDKPVGACSHFEKVRVGRCLRMLGWESYRPYDSSFRGRRYRRAS
ncbi:MAG: VapE domain-containing protein [Bryobacteraceae bacterium]